MIRTSGFAVLLVATACGNVTGSSGPQATPSPSPTIIPSPQPTPEPTPDLTAFNECSETVKPLMEALVQLDGRLDVGQTFVEYGDRLEEISVEYDRLARQMEDVGLDCLNVAVKLEGAFQSYFSAHRIWDDCFDNYNCDVDSIEPRLQRLWLKASNAIDTAQKRLRDLKS